MKDDGPNDILVRAVFYVSIETGSGQSFSSR